MAASAAKKPDALQCALRADDYAEVARCLAAGANPNARSTEPSAEGKYYHEYKEGYRREEEVTEAPLLIHARSQGVLELMLTYGADAATKFKYHGYHPTYPISQFFQVHADASRKALHSCFHALVNGGAQRDAELVRLRAIHHQSICVLATDLSLNGVERMLARGANPLALDGANRNALDCVFASAEPSSTLAHRILDTLLVAAQRSPLPERFSTALHLFATYGSDEALENELDSRANPFALSGEGKLALDIATASQRDPLAKVALLAAAMREQLSAIVAPSAGPLANLERVTDSLLRAKALDLAFVQAASAASALNAPLRSGGTLLHVVAQHGDEAMLHCALTGGASPFVLHRESGLLPADLAARNARYRDGCVVRLVAAMRDQLGNGSYATQRANVPDCCSIERAVQCCIELGLFSVPLLCAAVGAGLNLNALLPNGASLLHLAARLGQETTVAALLGAGADPHVIDASGAPATTKDETVLKLLNGMCDVPAQFAGLRAEFAATALGVASGGGGEASAAVPGGSSSGDALVRLVAALEAQGHRHAEALEAQGHRHAAETTRVLAAMESQAQVHAKQLADQGTQLAEQSHKHAQQVDRLLSALEAQQRQADAHTQALESRVAQLEAALSRAARP